MAKLYKYMNFRAGESINDRGLVPVEKLARVGVGTLSIFRIWSWINDF